MRDVAVILDAVEPVVAALGLELDDEEVAGTGRALVVRARYARLAGGAEADGASGHSSQRDNKRRADARRSATAMVGTMTVVEGNSGGAAVVPPMTVVCAVSINI